MIGQVARLVSHEWRIQARNGVVLVLALSFVFLTGVAIGLGRDRVVRAAADARALSLAIAPAARAHDVEYLANQHGIFAILPPAPLLALTAGQSEVYPDHFRVTARLRDAQLTGDQLEHPMVLHSGHLDLAFVVLFLLPLLVIAASHDLVASDREQGTLRLLLVQGASITRLAMGKVAARLAVVVLLPVIAATLAAWLDGAPDAPLARLILWVVAATVYALVWLGLAVHVNARGRSAAGNALVLSGCWLAFVIVIPSLVNLATRVIHPVPSRVQLETTMREAAREAVAEGSRTLGRYLEDHPSAGIGQDGMRQYYALQDQRDAAVAARLRPLLAAFDTQRAAQARLTELLQYASPTLVAQLALTDAAGTSGHRARRFADEAAMFQQRWRAHFTPDVLSGTVPLGGDTPAFEYDEEGMAAVVARTAPPLIGLAAAAIVLLWTGIRRFATYDVTGAAS